MTLLLDTTVLIDVLRKRKGRRRLLSDLFLQGHVLATSTITHAELFAGSTPQEEAEIVELLSRLGNYPVTPAIGRRGGALKNAAARAGRTVGLPDALIAATAIEHGLTLMTDNRKDFLSTELQFYPLPA